MRETVFMPSTSIWELIIRGTVLYLAIFAMMRIAGRRESGELNTTDLIVIVIISEAASVGIGGKASSIFDSLILVLTILLWSVVLDAMSYRWKWMAILLKPRPKPLIVDGELNHRTARHEFLTKEEVLSQLCQQGLSDMSEVRRAYVEPNGNISIIKRD